jgi:hypothetical protein
LVISLNEEKKNNNTHALACALFRLFNWKELTVVADCVPQIGKVGTIPQLTWKRYNTTNIGQGPLPN